MWTALTNLSDINSYHWVTRGSRCRPPPPPPPTRLPTKSQHAVISTHTHTHTHTPKRQIIGGTVVDVYAGAGWLTRGGFGVWGSILSAFTSVDGRLRPSTDVDRRRRAWCEWALTQVRSSRAHQAAVLGDRRREAVQRRAADDRRRRRLRSGDADGGGGRPLVRQDVRRRHRPPALAAASTAGTAARLATSASAAAPRRRHGDVVVRRRVDRQSLLRAGSSSQRRRLGYTDRRRHPVRPVKNIRISARGYFVVSFITYFDRTRSMRLCP